MLKAVPCPHKQDVCCDKWLTGDLIIIVNSIAICQLLKSDVQLRLLQEQSAVTECLDALQILVRHLQGSAKL